MPEADQITDRALRCSDVIHSYPGYPRLGQWRKSIRIHNRYVAGYSCGSLPRSAKRRHSNHAINSAAFERIKVTAFIFPALARIADQKRVLHRSRIIFRTSDKLNIETVR